MKRLLKKNFKLPVLKMNNIYEFLSHLRASGAAIWLSGKNIKFSFPSALESSQTDQFIINHKNDIVSLLEYNSIFSKEEFLSKIILKGEYIDRYPLSSTIERICFFERLESGTSVYHVPSIFQIRSHKDLQGIKFAIRQIVSRHEILRTTIHLDSHGRGFQVVNDSPVTFEEERVNSEQSLQSQITADISRPFDLKTQYPIRVKIYVISAELADNAKIFLLINFHHIATDGWSIKIFEKELADFFLAYNIGNHQFQLPALEIQFKHYSIWQRSHLTGIEKEEQLRYWAKILEGYEVLRLPTDFSRKNKMDYRGARKTFSFNKSISDRIRRLARQYGVTLHGLFIGSLSILLSKYTGQEDIIIGSPIANRHHRQTEGLIGCFVNTIVNRVLLSDNQGFAELICQIHEHQISAQRFQDFPFEKLVSELAKERDPSGSPIFSVLLAVQGSGELEGIGALKDVLKPFQLNTPHEPARLDIAVYMDDTKELISGAIVYATSLFREDTIERLVLNYEKLMEQLIDQPMKPYAELCILSPKEYEQVVDKWKGTIRKYPSKTIHRLFQEQVERTPHSPAIVFEGQSLTYKELDEKSNQLAWQLRAKYEMTVGCQLVGDTLIGLYVDRSLEMIVGVLAVLKAGGAYVPIDINYPQNRIKYLLEDTNTQLILSQRKFSLAFDIEVINIDLDEDLYRQNNTTCPFDDVNLTNLAYVIYTSGTTGKPKGVMVEHAGLVNLVLGQSSEFEISKDSKALQFAPLAFDASVSEIFTGLTSGSTLFVATNSIRQDPDLLIDFLEHNRISIATIPPAILNILPYRNLSSLKVLVVAGELCAQGTIDLWSTGRKLINAYGPTENTVCATMHQWHSGSVHTNIGKSLDNVSVYVLDKYMNPVPIGVKGELYVGGLSLARGYLNNVTLTTDVFVEKKFSGPPHTTRTRLYKTGDQVRWLPCGSLEFYGRKDSQVKIRGYRIELQEIEQSLLQIKGIKQCCVLVADRNSIAGPIKYLVGYYTLDKSSDKLEVSEAFDHLSHILPDYLLGIPSNSKGISKEWIYQQLKESLPEYMIPDDLLLVNSIPLTANGKIDKDNLPVPEATLFDNSIPPITEKEGIACDIWGEILGRERIGVTDDFFRVGGNSILAIQVSHRMSQALNCSIKVSDIFKFKTIKNLIGLLADSQSSATDSGENWELSL